MQEINLEDQKINLDENIGFDKKLNNNETFDDLGLSEKKENIAGKLPKDSEVKQESSDFSKKETLSLEGKAFYQPMVESIREFFKFIQYKRVHPYVAIVVAILLSSFFFLTLICIACFYILLFFTKLMASPGDFLANSLRNENKNQFVQIVIYYFGFPFVLFFRITIALISIVFQFVYFFYSIFSFIFSCGGMKVQPFLFDATNDMKKCFKREKVSKEWQTAVGIVVTILLLTNFIISIVKTAPALSTPLSTRTSASITNPTTREPVFAISKDSAFTISENMEYTVNFPKNSGRSGVSKTFWVKYTPSVSGTYVLSLPNTYLYTYPSIDYNVYRGSSEYPFYSYTFEAGSLNEVSMDLNSAYYYYIEFVLSESTSSVFSMTFTLN